MPAQLSADHWSATKELIKRRDQLVATGLEDARSELYWTGDGQIEGAIMFLAGEGFKHRIINTPKRLDVIAEALAEVTGGSAGRIRLGVDGVPAQPQQHRRRPAPAEPVEPKPRAKVRGKTPKLHRSPTGEQWEVPPLGVLLTIGEQELRLNILGERPDNLFEAFLRSAYDLGIGVRFVGDYRAYLGSQYWRESGRRLRALERAEHRCAVCNADGQLDVHHRCYDRLGFEADSDLIALCRECHERHHGKRGRAAS